MEKPDFYVSHIVRPIEFPVSRIDNKPIDRLFFQIITSTSSSRMTICWIEDGIKRFFNCEDQEEMKKTMKFLLSKYEKFRFEILTLDKLYGPELSVVIVSNFINGEKNLQEKIDQYNLGEDLK